MTCNDCTPKLHDFLDRDPTLSAADAHALESHLTQCAACRAELESLRRLRAATAALPRELPPSRDLWPEISSQLADAAPAPRSRPSDPRVTGEDVPFSSTFPARDDQPETQPKPAASILAFPLPRLVLPLAVAATIAVLCTFAARRPQPASLAAATPAWSVAAVAGAPRVAAKPVRREAPFRVGQWLETDAHSRAKVAVGSIGEVRVEPNSRVRLVGAAATDHRIELARGTVDALIWAPPRLFFVDTPSATAVDLGCAYTLTVDDAGDGELHVTAGYVALEHGDRESIIPSGQKCLTRRGAGPGTPFAADASPALRAALETFDFGPAATRPRAVTQILALARPDDAVTLWHLLARAAPEQRPEIHDTLARLSPPPQGVTREGILSGDVAMQRAWSTALGLGTFFR